MANEFANQYGINLGAIDNAISQKKTAQQNLEINKMRMNSLQRQDTKDIAADKAEQDYMQDPSKAVAATVAQKLQWDTLNKAERADKAAALKEHINERGIAINSVMGIQDPAQQQQALQQEISKLPPEEQAQFAQKYGSTPQDWQAKLPNIMNDLIVASNGVDYLTKQIDQKNKHANDLDLVRAKGESEAGIRANQNAFTSKENALNREATSENVMARIQSGDSNKEFTNALKQQSIDTAKEKAAEQQRQTRVKTAEKYVANVPNFDSLSSEDQETAKNIYIETGKVPEISSEEGKVSKLTGGKVSFGKNYKLKNNSDQFSNTTTRPPLSQF